MKFNNGFIGYTQTNVVNKFSGGDTEQEYLNNLITQPDDWYYRFHEITYEYNSYGHRSKNIENIDLNNYILFTGCSHTEGIGLELEKTFAYLVADRLGLDYYNLALGGTGIDVMTHNLMMWINTVKKLPKALVILWPQTNRFVRLTDCGDFLCVEVPANPSSSATKKFIVLGEEINFFKAVKKMSEEVISSAYPCQIINLYYTILSGKDRARDLSHAGILGNNNTADYIVQQLR